MKREVATLEVGNFRGVCPIFNRAKQECRPILARCIIHSVRQSLRGLAELILSGAFETPEAV